MKPIFIDNIVSMYDASSLYYHCRLVDLHGYLWIFVSKYYGQTERTFNEAGQKGHLMSPDRKNFQYSRTERMIEAMPTGTLHSNLHEDLDLDACQRCILPQLKTLCYDTQDANVSS